MEISNRESNTLVSVIVPVYNGEKYLVECLNALASQIYNNYEVIMVDDGSTDSSADICDRYAEKNGIGIGDVMHLHSVNFGEYDLTVAGIYEDFMAGNPYSYLSAIVDDDTYGMIKNRSDELEASGLRVILAGDAEKPGQIREALHTAYDRAFYF